MRWNRAAESMFGFDSADRGSDALPTDPHVRSVAMTAGDRSKPIENDSGWQSSAVLVEKQDGRKESVIRLSRSVLIEGARWRLVIFRNPAMEHFAESELSRLALTDSLSELLNRRGFRDACHWLSGSCNGTE